MFLILVFSLLERAFQDAYDVIMVKKENGAIPVMNVRAKFPADREDWTAIEQMCTFFRRNIICIYTKSFHIFMFFEFIVYFCIE